MKKILLLLLFLPSALFAQTERGGIERLLLTAFGINRPNQDSESMVGSRVPDFRLVTPDGEVFTRESLHGKIIVMDFWATWCGGCKMMAQDFERDLMHFPKDKVVFLGVTYKEKNEELGLKYWKEAGYSFPMTLNSQELGDALKATHPSSVVIDQNGIVRAHQQAYGGSRTSEIEMLVDYLLGNLEISRASASKALQQKDYKRALVVIDEMIAEDPDAERSLYSMRFDALMGLSGPDYRVPPYIEHLKRKYPDQPDVMLQLATQVVTGNVSSKMLNRFALDSLQENVSEREQMSGNPYIFYFISRCHFRLGQTTEAIVAAEKALRLGEEKGVIAQDMQMIRNAITEYKGALDE